MSIQCLKSFALKLVIRPPERKRHDFIKDKDKFKSYVTQMYKNEERACEFGSGFKYTFPPFLLSNRTDECHPVLRSYTRPASPVPSDLQTTPARLSDFLWYMRSAGAVLRAQDLRECHVGVMHPLPMDRGG